MDLKIVEWLLAESGRGYFKVFTDLAEWITSAEERAPAWAGPLERAVAMGFTGDRTAYAFAGGYQAALQALFGGHVDFRFGALCVTEEGGGHPGAMRTLIKEEKGGYVIDGRKKFISMADLSDTIFVAGATGLEEKGRPVIKIAAVSASSPGVSVRNMPELPFIPEIGHGEVVLSDVYAEKDALLPGDGYSDYVKPFRTVEDIHVFGGVAGYIFRVAAEYRWEKKWMESILETVAALVIMAGEDPSADRLHVALGGLISGFNTIVEGSSDQWDRVDPEVRERWERDRKLLTVAGKAREKRLAGAWERFGFSGR